jgi:hypothetical protein
LAFDFEVAMALTVKGYRVLVYLKSGHGGAAELINRTSMRRF